jgi:hypothetical protein
LIEKWVSRDQSRDFWKILIFEKGWNMSIDNVFELADHKISARRFPRFFPFLRCQYCKGMCQFNLVSGSGTDLPKAPWILSRWSHVLLPILQHGQVQHRWSNVALECGKKWHCLYKFILFSSIFIVCVFLFTSKMKGLCFHLQLTSEDCIGVFVFSLYNWGLHWCLCFHFTIEDCIDVFVFSLYNWGLHWCFCVFTLQLRIALVFLCFHFTIEDCIGVFVFSLYNWGLHWYFCVFTLQLRIALVFLCFHFTIEDCIGVFVFSLYNWGLHWCFSVFTLQLRIALVF